VKRTSNTAGSPEEEAARRRHTLPAVVGLGGIPMERSGARSGEDPEVPTGWMPPTERTKQVRFPPL
jgi:hypothetical protein